MHEPIPQMHAASRELEDDAFTAFATEVGGRLRIALSARYGAELGPEVTGDALLFAWQHWDRVRSMRNPAGYLYRVGARRATRILRRERRFSVGATETPVHATWVEPELHAVLQSLSDRQRAAVLLVHAFEWTLAEVAELWGVRRSTVQRHVARAMVHLRSALGVQDDE